MARNKKNKKKGEGDKDFICIRLDKESMTIWNKKIQTINMSEWIRQQLKFHFSNMLTVDQQAIRLKEEITILRRQRAESLKLIELGIGLKVFELERLNIDVVVNPHVDL